MPYLDFASKIREGLGIARAAELKRLMPERFRDPKPDTIEAAQKKIYETTVLGYEKAQSFATAMSSVKGEIENILEADCNLILPQDSFSERLHYIRMNLQKKINQVFSQIPVTLFKRADEQIDTLNIGLNTGLRVVINTLNTIAHKIFQDTGNISREIFLKKAKESYEFIEELTRLSIATIAPIEHFLKGARLDPHPLFLPENIIEKTMQISIDLAPEKLYALAIELTNDLMSWIGATCMNIKHYNLDKVEFHKQGSLTLTDSAIKNFIKQYRAYMNKFITVKQAALQAMSGDPKGLKFTETTNFCPARAVPITDKETNREISLTEAMYKYYIRQLEKMPNLDLLLNEFVLKPA